MCSVNATIPEGTHIKPLQKINMPSSAVKHRMCETLISFTSSSCILHFENRNIIHTKNTNAKYFMKYQVLLNTDEYERPIMVN